MAKYGSQAAATRAANKLEVENERLAHELAQLRNQSPNPTTGATLRQEIPSARPAKTTTVETTTETTTKSIDVVDRGRLAVKSGIERAKGTGWWPLIVGVTVFFLAVWLLPRVVNFALSLLPNFNLRLTDRAASNWNDFRVAVLPWVWFVVAALFAWAFYKKTKNNT